VAGARQGSLTKNKLQYIWFNTNPKEEKNMKRTMSSLALIFVLVFLALPALAALQLPNYAASGANLSSDLEATGGTITKVLIAITVMVGIAGIVFSGMAFASGDGETGKQRLKNAVIGLAIAATASGIAAIATGGH